MDGTTMKTILALLMQPSSFAGYACLMTAIPAVIAAPANPVAWGGILAALAAVLKNESGAS